MNHRIVSVHHFSCLATLLLMLIVGMGALAAPAEAGPGQSDFLVDASGAILGEISAPAPSGVTMPAQNNLKVLCYSAMVASPCPRLQQLFPQTTTVDDLADFPADLTPYDVVYIGAYNSHFLRDKNCQLIDYVRQGGGLIVEQPCWGGPVGLFPAGFEVVVASDLAPVVGISVIQLTPAGAAHPMLTGLTKADLSPAFDTVFIDQMGPGWSVLATSVGRPTVVLAAGSYGSGHLVFHTGLINPLVGRNSGSDAYVQQMLTWAGTPGSPAAPDPPQESGVFVVNTTDDLDDGVCGLNHCSLREAITAANDHSNGAQPDVIRFELPCATRQPVVKLRFLLPIITDPAQISGATSHGMVELDGSAVSFDGLSFNTHDSQLSDFIIHGFGWNGVVFHGDNNVVTGCYIGTRGMEDLGNGKAGVSIWGSHNRVGGEAAGAGNLIASNGGAGVLVQHGSGNVVLGNFIGVNALGDAALPNATGVELDHVSRCTVGGESSGARNLISGNAGPGVLIKGGEANKVLGNVIGLDLNVSQALGNETGVRMSWTKENQVGAEGAGGNVIAGNRTHGVYLSHSRWNEVQHNRIGVTLAGAAVGNGGSGVLLDESSEDNEIVDNRIAFNQQAGVKVDGPIHNGILRNLIYENGDGIENVNRGDADVPPPAIETVTADQVSGRAPAHSIVQIFGDDGDQARYYLGETRADASGRFTFVGQLRGKGITSTATPIDTSAQAVGVHAYNTSSLSAAVPRPSPCDDPHESNDTWLQAWSVSPGDVIHGYICEPGDIDFYKLPASAVTFGGRVHFRLQNSDADLDMVLFRPTYVAYDLPTTDLPPAQAPFADVPIKSLPLQNIPLQNIPLQNIPLQNIPLQNIPLQNIPLQNIPLQNIPLQNIPLQNIPLQNIPLQNIPLQNIPLQNIPVVDYSVNPGGQDEEVTDRAVYASDAYYLMIIGHNGAYGSKPYTLTIENDPPPPVSPCTFHPPYSGRPGELDQIYPLDESRTLILIPKQRLEAMYGEDEVTKLTGALHRVAYLSSVKGMIVPVESDERVAQAYADWDEHFCDPQRANAVAGRIKGLIYQYAQKMPNLQYVILIGNDTALPFRRLPDLVETANERIYAPQALLKSDNALYAALKQGYLLSDDFYGDFYPSMYAGWPLYAPDFSLGRLVETPAEITAQLEQFKERKGKLSAHQAAVFGYDFLKDSTQQMATTLSQQGFQPQVLNNDDWTAAALRNALLQDRHDLTVLNAHFTHFLLAPAAFALKDQGDLFRAGEIADAAVDMSGSINASVGCHSGLNVCDECVSQQGKNMHADLDFAQAFARKQGVWIGNTGFGYGDDAAVALSEELVDAFVRYLGSQRDMPVGEALRLAKREYALFNMGAYGPYDRKALAEMTLYGIPNYQVTAPYPRSVHNEDRISAGPVRQVGNLRHLKSREFTLSPRLTTVSTPRGDYYQAEDGIQPLLYNPIQPRSQFDISLDSNDHPGFVAHGVLLLDGRYQDKADFDPVITMPITDTQRYEPQIIFSEWQPLTLTRINHFTTDKAAQEWLTVTPGQFRHQRVENSDPQDVHVVGTERVYQQLRFAVYYSDAADFSPPIIHQVQGTRQDKALTFDVQVSDPEGVLRVLTLCSADNGRWQAVELTADSLAHERWRGTLQNAGMDAFCLVQVVDGAGNVSLTAAKGALHLPEMPYRGYLPLLR